MHAGAARKADIDRIKISGAVWQKMAPKDALQKSNDQPSPGAEG
jgi:hypothetical protein